MLVSVPTDESVPPSVMVAGRRESSVQAATKKNAKRQKAR